MPNSNSNELAEVMFSSHAYGIANKYLSNSKSSQILFILPSN